MTLRTPNDAQWAEIDAAIAGQSMMLAIRLYREATGAALAVAHATLQARVSASPPAPAIVPASGEPPPVVARFLESGFARRGETWAWWRLANGDHCVLVRHAHGGGADFELSVFPEGSGSWAHDANGFTLGTTELAAAARAGTPLRNVAWPADGDALERVRRRLEGEAEREPRVARPGFLDHSRTAVFRLASGPFEASWLRLQARLHESEWARVLHAIRAEPAAADLLDEAGDCFSRDGIWVTPRASASRAIWGACAAQCSRDGYVVEASDAYFRDLSTSRIPDAGGPEGFQVARFLFRKVVDLEDEDRGRLPPWMHALRGSLTPGLLSPGELRVLGANRVELQAWLEARAHPGDTHGILELMSEAARQGDWVVGLEPT